MNAAMSVQVSTHYHAELRRVVPGFGWLARLTRSLPGLQPMVPRYTAWAEDFHNLVVTAGLNKLLDATLKTGLAAPAWYVGLKDTGTVAAGDTLASHAGWAELTNYSGTRPAFTPGTISAGSVNNSASKASFTFTGGDDIYGAFMCDAASGTSGTLYGAGDFASPRTVITDDVLNVTVTASVAAA